MPDFGLTHLFSIFLATLGGHNDVSGNAVSKIDTSTDGQGDTPSSVIYKTNNWESYTHLNLQLSETKKIIKLLGEVISKDENSLDITALPATKYRFVENDMPFHLNLIESPQYLELSWYFAQPGDTEQGMKASVAHAKGAYKVATAIMGEQGAQLTTGILSGKKYKNFKIGEHQIVLAYCEYNSCIIVWAK